MIERLHILFFVFNLSDYFSTIIALNLGGNELNPIMNFLFKYNYVYAFLFKFLIVLFIMYFVQKTYLSLRYNSTKKIVLIYYFILTVGYLIITISNIRNIILLV